MFRGKGPLRDPEDRFSAALQPPALPPGALCFVDGAFRSRPLPAESPPRVEWILRGREGVPRPDASAGPQAAVSEAWRHAASLPPRTPSEEEARRGPGAAAPAPRPASLRAACRPGLQPSAAPPALHLRGRQLRRNLSGARGSLNRALPDSKDASHCVSQRTGSACKSCSRSGTGPLPGLREAAFGPLGT